MSDFPFFVHMAMIFKALLWENGWLSDTDAFYSNYVYHKKAKNKLLWIFM